MTLSRTDECEGEARMADLLEMLRKMAAGDAALTRGAMGAAVTEIVRLRTDIAHAREAVGAGWLAGGVSLAEAIRMKTRALERLFNGNFEVTGPERGEADALARAWEEGAEAAFDAQDPGPDSDYLNPLYGRALDEFYASNPYRRAKKGGGVAWESGGTDD